MAESIQKKLKRVRPPRVQLEYEVETEGATIVKDLPFVVGVMGDLSGHPTKKLDPLKDRSFVEIDRDNINDVMKKMTPGLNLRVENTMEGDGSEIAVDLKFESMDDFAPAKVAEQVEPLRKMLETRNKLRDLLTKVDRSGDLEELLENVLQNTDQIKQLSSELGIDSDGGGDDNSPAEDGGE